MSLFLTCETRIRVGWLTTAISAIAVLCIGCASQGPLQPPSLNLPQPAQKLVAMRVGDRVELNWTTSANTSDGVKMKGPIAADICVNGQPSANSLATAAARNPKKRSHPSAIASSSTPCHAVKHLTVTPGAVVANVDLGAALATGAPHAVAYSIELRNAAGRSAGPSAPVFVAAGEGPPTPGTLKIVARREGAVVEWRADSAPAVVELRRTWVATSAGPVADAAETKSAKSPTPFSPGAKQPPHEVVLRPDAAAGKDAGGILDTSVRDGDTYRYVAQRVETVTLSGQTLEMRSALSPPVDFTYRDVFPPQPPTGLLLIPGGGFGEPPSIDLSWDADFESDLLGFNIYRGSGAEFVKLNPAPDPVPSFRDLQVAPGQQYTYRVTAVDRRGNESAPGTSTTETLRK